MLLTFSIIGLLCVIASVNSYAPILPSKFDAKEKVPSISIVGGTPAAKGEFPYTAMCKLDRLPCGGVIIGPYHVLTAAHCLTMFNQSDVVDFEVWLNMVSFFGDEPNIIVKKVKKFFFHEWFVDPNNPTYAADIGLLVLSSPVAANYTFALLPTDPAPKTTTTTKKTTTKKPTTKKPTTKKTTTKKFVTTKPTTRTTTPKRTTTKKPASAVRAYSSYVNATATIIGWGETRNDNDTEVVLRKANVKILDNSICLDQYGGKYFNGTEMLCASAPGIDTCQGDSGGPILVGRVLVGITAFGNGCADPRYAGVYTRVTHYMDWIRKLQADNPN